MQKAALLFLALVGIVAVQALADDSWSEADAARRAKVFATVGSERITVGELEDIAAARPAEERRRLKEPAALRKMADQEVQDELFYQGAAKLGYENDLKVRQVVDQAMVKLFVDEELVEAIRPEGVSEERVTKYYQEHPEKFRRPEMRSARHILVASEEEAQEILEELQSNGTQDFGALAKKHSLDSATNMRGGNLLYFTADGKVFGTEDSGTIDPTLAQAAFSLDKPGDFSETIDLGDDRWSVLQLTGIRPERVEPLAQRRRAIRSWILRDERQDALEALIEGLRNELQPEVHPERVEAIVFERSPKNVPRAGRQSSGP